MSQVPNVVLNNGKTIPVLGLGTWNSPPGEVAQAVKDAIDAGYRHIDGAFIYGNEAEVGDGLTAKIAEGVVRREDVFITSKLWNSFHHPDTVRGALEASLKNLQTTYLDLYLIHWPFSYKEGGELFPKDAEGKPHYTSVDYVDTWKEMEKAVDDGLVKSIGISNFNKHQTERILASCRIKPVTNQIECHPYLTQLKLTEFLKANDIAVTAYSPLGSPARPGVKSTDPVLMDEPKVLTVAEKYKKSPAQVLIRYQIQRGHIVIPKSVTKSRIVTNFDVFDFTLTSEEVESINTLECNGRGCTMDFDSTHPDWPFNNEY